MTPPAGPTHPTCPSAAETEEFRGAWLAELARIELDVDRAEAMLSANDPEPLPAWEAPQIGPLPADLVPRARLVLERQLAVAHQLTLRISSTDQQRRLTQRIRDSSTPDVPVYLDITA